MKSVFEVVIYYTYEKRGPSNDRKFNVVAKDDVEAREKAINIFNENADKNPNRAIVYCSINKVCALEEK
jgi:hypothetical protein